jgi:tetratricopeptide (TPR) repeat protein
LAAAEKAVALDDSLPLAHTYLAWVHVWKKQHEQAIAEGERAIAFDHNFAEGYAYLGNILNFAGKPEEAVAAIERAMRLDPHYPPNYLVYLARGYDLLGKREDAIAALRKCITLDPDRFAAHQLLASIYGQLGRKEEAEVEVAEMLRIRRHADFNTSLADQREKIPYKDQAVLERYLEGLRKAGLPE